MLLKQQYEDCLKNYEISDQWIDINTMKVPFGSYKNCEPAQKNKVIIRFLRKFPIISQDKLTQILSYQLRILHLKWEKEINREIYKHFW